MLSNYSLQVLTDLAGKPIFCSSDWLELSINHGGTNNVAVDLLCAKCGKEKTFLGKAYNRTDLSVEYQRASIMKYAGAGTSPFDFVGDNDDTAIEEMIAEIAFPVGDTVTIQLKCPTCGSPLYICYAVEFEKDPKRARNVFNDSDREPDKYRVHKIGEYPNQEISRSQVMSKYVSDFPAEHSYLLKAEKAFSVGLGVGAIIYLRKAYEVLLYTVAKNKGIARPQSFRQALEEIDKVAGIVPVELANHAYGLFGEMSDIVHGEPDDSIGISKYELLRDVFKMILDNILEKRRLEELAKRIKPDGQAKRGGSIK